MSKPKKLSVGDYVHFWYFTPAFSCFTSHKVWGRGILKRIDLENNDYYIFPHWVSNARGENKPGFRYIVGRRTIRLIRKGGKKSG